MADHVYCYPNSDILINKLNIHDGLILQAAERDLTSRRLVMLQTNPIKGTFDFLHLKKIHEFIFQDIYSWAGKERTVDIAKSNMFCNVRFIDEQALEIFTNLKKENLLNGLSREKFTERITYYFGEVNALHPFREGNGRTQREFFRELALHDGYVLDYSGITKEEMIDASIDSFLRKYDKLAALLNRALSENVKD
jgi:cell filamentation protein